MSNTCQVVEIRRIPATHTADEITNFTSAVCAVVATMSTYGGTGSELLFQTWADTYSANHQLTFTTVAANSADWYQTLSFNEVDATLTISDGNSVSLSALSGAPVDLSQIQAASGNWNSAYNTVNTNSGTWDYQGNDVKSLTAAWENIKTVVSNNSSIWVLSGISSYTETDPIFVSWAQTYSSLFLTVSEANTRFVELTGDIMTGGLSAPSLSCDTLYVGASTIYFVNGDGIVNSIKSSDVFNWNSNYTTVNSYSANWQTSFDRSIVYAANSANYNSLFVTVQNNSALWIVDQDDAEVNSLVQNNSAEWNTAYDYSLVFSVNSATYASIFNTVNANSAVVWNYQGNDIKALSAKWETVSNYVQTNSATWLTQETDPIFVTWASAEPPWSAPVLWRFGSRGPTHTMNGSATLTHPPGGLLAARPWTLPCSTSTPRRPAAAAG